MAVTGTPARVQGRHGRIRLLRTVALALDGVSLAFAVFFVVAGAVFGQRGDELPTDNWWLFGPMLGAGLAGFAGGVVALVAAVRGDRHAILAIPLALGGLAVLAAVGLPALVLPGIVAGLTWFVVLARGQNRRRS